MKSTKVTLAAPGRWSEVKRPRDLREAPGGLDGGTQTMLKVVENWKKIQNGPETWRRNGGNKS